MSTSTPDPLAALAEALWPYLEQGLARDEAHEETVHRPVAMSRKEAARYLGMTPNGLRKRTHALLRPRRLPGYSRPLYFRRDLDSWLSLGEPRREGV